ncbi:MAG: methionine--tRNA ligase [Pseudomonadota bacterium]
MNRKMLVTSALPYANGAIHIGHLVEYIQTDIWVRFQKMRGHTCWYVCADDTHGSAIMLRAEKEGITPEALIGRVHSEHQRDFAGFQIGFDHYDTTHTETTRALASEIYLRLKDAGLIEKRLIEQYYDPVKAMFLPDRFIKGECPKCAAPDQYGDNCERCGAAYTPNDLKAPYSAISGATPELRSSEHYFFKLSDPRCQNFLRSWTQNEGRLQDEAANKLQEWLGAAGEHTLSDWDISRDAPYFGFEIPDAPGKYFYVWLDAPIGYMSAFKNLCAKQGLDFDEYWRVQNTTAENTTQTELYHFIGKDILYFHALFWPAELNYAGYRTPSKIFAHGFLTVDGAKMSKSRGTFITAESYLAQGLNPEWLRYYFAAKLSDTMEDIDLNFDDFIARVNADLIGKLVNIASRSAGFISKRFAGALGVCDPALPAFQAIYARRANIEALFEGRKFNQAMREIMALADLANQYVDQVKPWELAKQAERNEDLHSACTNALNLFRLLIILLKPVLPTLAAQVENFLNINTLSWQDATEVLPAGHLIKPYHHLMTRIEQKQIDALLAANQSSATPSDAATATIITSNAGIAQAEASAALTPSIGLDEFMKIELRVARIQEASAVDGADKLIRLQLDLGALGTRQVFAGIKAAYDPAQLVGRLTVVVANLAPRKMKFGLSEGMVLAASDDAASNAASTSGKAPSTGIFLLSPDDGAQPGMRIK